MNGLTHQHIGTSMACRVELVADCGDIAGLSRALYIADKEDASWLNQCCVSLSSCGTLLCFAYRNRLCLLMAQWIGSTESNTYLISWNGNLPSEASAILALPISSSSLSSQNGADWICIIVGYKSGEIGFYTNTGHLLLTEKLESRPVLSISCHTGSFGSDADDIHILFQSSMCVLTGSSLFQTLRFAKAQLARVQAGVLSEFSLDGKNILSRKWQFVDQDVINDAAVVGLELKNTYDHLLAASTFGGYDTWYRSVPPHNTLVLGAGARPYLGFHYALEGGSTPPLQDVARAVASKIKSALPGWLGGGTSKSTTSVTESKVKEESLSMRSGIGDLQRQATSVVLSPDRRLAALTDNLGRIAVLHVHKGCLIRLFKGYRDSQCAFMQVFEQDSKRGPTMNNVKEIRKATFLIIYNPKKGLIDIRLMQRGSRVAAFTATKNGKLIYNTYGLVGSENNYSQKKLNLPSYPCVLLDPDGKIKKIVIPFHNALEGENSQRSKDLHLIKEFKYFIRQKSYDQESLQAEILNTAKELKMPDLKRHCLEIIIGKSEVPPSAVMCCLELFLQELSTTDQLTPEDLKLKHFCKSLKGAALLYLHMNNKNYVVNNSVMTADILCDGDKESGDICNIHMEADVRKDFTKRFSLTEMDNSILKRLLSLAQETINKDGSTSKVTFADDKRSSFKEFVTAFDFDNNKEHVELKGTLQSTQLSALSLYTFKTIFAEKYPTEKFEDIVKASNINPKVLVKLLIAYCMDMSLNEVTIEVVEKFIEVLFHICQASEEAMHIVYNEINPWWQNIRDILVDMPCPLRTMIIATVCKSVCQLLEQGAEMMNVDDAWVSLTTETAKWSMLIGKLEDIAILSIVLQSKGSVKGKSLPKLKFTELEINLKYIYNRGKGAVSELIAKWLCSKGVTPEAIQANEILEIETKNLESQVSLQVPPKNDDDPGYLMSDCDRVCVEENPEVFKWLNLVTKQFPFSASTTNVIANMCWEYAAAWQKDTTDMEKLKAVICCLNNITNIHLCTGMCTLIWMTFIRGLFESACRLVNKVGKLPKERLCFQDVGLKDTNMLEFLQLTNKYLDRFLYCASKVNKLTKPILEFEKIWDESIPALVEVAQGTDKINHDILNLTHQIASTIYYQCYFNIKLSKPLNTLFDCDLQYIFGGMALSDEVNSEVNMRSSDGKVRGQRMKFLCKVIAAALELISCEDTPSGDTVYRSADSLAWIEKTYTLAELWNIDSDFIRREQIVGLYKLGYDSLAEDIITTAHEPELLLQPLVHTCAKRLKRCLEASSDLSNVLAALPPELAVYLQSEESDTTISANVSLKTTASVLANVICRVHNTKASAVQQNLRLAELMIYGCDILQEFNHSQCDS